MLYTMGIVFLAVGLILRVFPPKRIGFVYGYRTNLSIKNQEIWNEAQRYSANSFMILGLIYGAAGVVLTELIGGISEGWQVSVFLLGVLWMIVFDELHLRRIFNRDGSRKTGL